MRNELTPLFLFHISLGTIALLSGAAALVFRKGSGPHRTAGKVFVASMLGMSASGIYLAVVKPTMISVVVGVLTFYLIATAWLTVHRKAGEIGRLEIAALLVVLATAAAGIGLGIDIANTESGADRHQVPAAIYFFFGGIAASCAALDIRVIYRGGVAGAQRIARHLWRMCFGLAITANAFFVGNPQVLPGPFKRIELRAAPVLVVLIVMMFWLVRVVVTKWQQRSEF